MVNAVDHSNCGNTCPGCLNARDRRTMAAIGEPVRTHDIPDPQEVPDELPQTEPVAVPEPAAVPA